MFRFTQQGVQRLKVPPKPKRYDKIHTLDGGGRALALRISYNGTKTWRVLYYVKGKPRTKTLDKFPKMSVKQAYESARKFEPESAAKKAEAGTLREVAQNFITNYVEVEKLRSQDEIVRCLTKYVYPQWGTRRFLDIGRADVATLRDHIREKHGARQANMVLAIISKLMNWYAANRSDTYASPIVRGMKYKTSARERVLSDDELRRVWNACEGSFGDIVKLLVLTAQRREKVGSMKWADLKDGVWSMPREPREKTSPGVLKLPQAAIDIIEARDQVVDNPFAFTGRVKGQPSIPIRRARLNSTRSCQPTCRDGRCTICAGRHAH